MFTPPKHNNRPCCEGWPFVMTSDDNVFPLYVSTVNIQKMVKNGVPAPAVPNSVCHVGAVAISNEVKVTSLLLGG